MISNGSKEECFDLEAKQMKERIWNREAQTKGGRKAYKCVECMHKRAFCEVLSMRIVKMMMGLEHWINAVATKVEYVRRGTGPVVDRTTMAIFESGEADSDEWQKQVKLAKSHYGILDTGFNVAVIGARSCGKSSLINGLRHVHDSDQGTYVCATYVIVRFCDCMFSSRYMCQGGTIGVSKLGDG
jgi:hypothetical protein